jgi:hypothetical protein
MLGKAAREQLWLPKVLLPSTQLPFNRGEREEEEDDAPSDHYEHSSLE